MGRKQANNSGPSTEMEDMMKNNHGEDLFPSMQDLMPFKIRDILLVASLYDAFILEEDRGLSEQIFGEYSSLGISSPPRVMLVPTAEKAFKELRKKRYDLVITMTHLFDSDPVKFGKKIKQIRSDVPVVLLVTDTGELKHYRATGGNTGIDRTFLWTGDSAIFLAIIKLFEDMKNVDHDTKYGDVRVILLVEDSMRYYSIFLPIMYKEIMRQTEMLIEESANEQERVLRRRARPKILLAETYEDALSIYKKYEEYILGVITDVSYPKGGKKDENAGFSLISNIDPDIPVLIQSSQPEHRAKAEDFGVLFVNKNSENLIYEFRSFLKEKMGFGEFVFKLPDGSVVGKAANMREFIELVRKVPAESLIYHGRKNQFSAWLLARGEIALAAMLRRKKISDFTDGEEMRRHLISVFEEAERKKSRGVISDFSMKAFIYENTITRFGAGSLGGKGRGIAFLSYIFQKTDFPKKYEKYGILIPSSFIISTEEFDRFMDGNELHDIRNKGLSDSEIKEVFLNAELSEELVDALKEYLAAVKEPIAVRSSSLLEDSYSQPFAGVYSTYILPNNEKSDALRLKHLSDAIKLVYASVYFKRTTAYIKTTLHTSDEDKMAVVLQKLVGNRRDSLFYPVFSGVAQSYNFYPQAPLSRDDGIVNLALGLGKIVVEGENFLTFSPKRPQVILGFSNTKDILQNSQDIFYALDMGKDDFDLREGEDSTIKKLHISDIKTHEDVMKWSMSIYDPQDDMLRDSLDSDGYPIITFAPILKYGMYPLPDMLRDILELCHVAMGGPVEIEFAAELKEGKPVLYVLQIRPILTIKRKIDIDPLDSENREKYLIYSTRSLGNGVITNINDIVFVGRNFERSRTEDIAKEIGEINAELEDAPYILIGPGRWGTKDRWLGIPVDWDQISHTIAMVETPISDRRVEPSQGSHFLHNIACLNIPYMTVDERHGDSFIDWDWLESQIPAERKKYVTHIRTEKPVEVRVDGESGRGAVMKEEESV